MSSSLRFSDTIIVTMWRTECHSFFGKFCNLFVYFYFFWNFLLSHSIFAEFTPSHDSCWSTCLGITLVSPALIPTTLLLPGYHACFFLLHTHYSALVWVSCLLFCSHTHYSALAWVSCLLFCSHTHYSALAWVSCSLFLLHTHYSALAWVSCLLFLLHTHADLRKQISKIKKRVCTPKQNIHTLFIKKSIPSYIVSYF